MMSTHKKHSTLGGLKIFKNTLNFIYGLEIRFLVCENFDSAGLRIQKNTSNILAR